MKTFEECQSDVCYWRIKESTIETINNYVLHKLGPGSFIRAVLENDFFEAVGRADIDNANSLKEIAMYIYNEIPAISFGSPEKVSAWLNNPSIKDE